VEDGDINGIAERSRALGDHIEHRLDIGWRAADHLLAPQPFNELEIHTRPIDHRRDDVRWVGVWLLNAGNVSAKRRCARKKASNTTLSRSA